MRPPRGVTAGSRAVGSASYGAMSQVTASCSSAASVSGMDTWTRTALATAGGEGAVSSGLGVGCDRGEGVNTCVSSVGSVLLSWSCILLLVVHVLLLLG